MISFIVGLIIGTMIGIFIMCSLILCKKESNK